MTGATTLANATPASTLLATVGAFERRAKARCDPARARTEVDVTSTSLSPSAGHRRAQVSVRGGEWGICSRQSLARPWQNVGNKGFARDGLSAFGQPHDLMLPITVEFTAAVVGRLDGRDELDAGTVRPFTPVRTPVRQPHLSSNGTFRECLTLFGRPQPRPAPELQHFALRRLQKGGRQGRPTPIMVVEVVHGAFCERSAAGASPSR